MNFKGLIKKLKSENTAPPLEPRFVDTKTESPSMIEIDLKLPQGLALGDQWREHRCVRIKHDVISVQTETQLLDILSSDENLQFARLRGRDTSSVGGIVGRDHFKCDGALERGWLKDLTKYIHEYVASEMDGHDLNHLLINRYPPGGGIMPHEDGPRYFPVVNILSLGSSCVMNFTSKHSAEMNFKIFIPPRSLLQFSSQAYKEYLHSIDFVSTDMIDNSVLWGPSDPEVPRTERYSLTLRYVPPDPSDL